MKRKLLVLMAVMMAAVSSPWAKHVNVDWAEIYVDGYRMLFHLSSEGTAELFEGRPGDNTTFTSIDIPPTVEYDGETYTVTSIAKEAVNFGEYIRNTTITSVTIPNTVTSIGYHAFRGFANLVSNKAVTTLTIPK